MTHPSPYYQLPLIPAYVNVTGMESLVLDSLVRVGPQTADEIAWQLRLPVTSVRPRLTGLEAKGLVERTGERRLTSAGRATGRGMKAAVYRRSA